MAKDPYPSETADRYIVRFPPGMRERLKEAAERHNRSMNAEIVNRLANSFGWDDLAEVPGYDRINPTADDVLNALELASRYVQKARDRGEIE